MLGTKSYRHTLRKCNPYCWSTATVVTWTRLIVILYVRCLSCVLISLPPATHPILRYCGTREQEICGTQQCLTWGSQIHLVEHIEKDIDMLQHSWLHLFPVRQRIQTHGIKSQVTSCRVIILPDSCQLPFAVSSSVVLTQPSHSVNCLRVQQFSDVECHMTVVR
jgi:hypothetical protein